VVVRAAVDIPYFITIFGVAYNASDMHRCTNMAFYV